MKRLCAMFFSVALLCASCIKDKESGVDLKVGDRLPEFVVTMNDGTETGTKQLSEGVSCIMFFTTGCPDCRETLPHIQKLYDEFAPKGVDFAVISREEGEADIYEYWAAEGLTMPFSAQSDRRIYDSIKAIQLSSINNHKEKS